jgi:hypothetical protein
MYQKKIMFTNEEPTQLNIVFDKTIIQSMLNYILHSTNVFYLIIIEF